MVRELMNILIEAECRENLSTREYLEQAYRMLHENIKNEWQYLAPEEKEDELNQREVAAKGHGGGRNSKNDKLTTKSVRRTGVDEKELQARKAAALAKVCNPHSGRFASLADFAAHFEIPVENLKQMMEAHTERDTLVK